MLELKNLTFSIEDTESDKSNRIKTIIDNFNFTFEKGKFYAITGPNGSGKTTLAKLVMGINKVSTDKIIFEGKDITGLSITERAQKGIAYSFQHHAHFKGTTFRDLFSIHLLFVFQKKSAQANLTDFFCG